MSYSTALTEAEYESKFKFQNTKNTPYLAPMGELWGVSCEDFGENWLHYNGTTLYISISDFGIVCLLSGVCESIKKPVTKDILFNFIDQHGVRPGGSMPPPKRPAPSSSDGHLMPPPSKRQRWRGVEL